MPILYRHMKLIGLAKGWGVGKKKLLHRRQEQKTESHERAWKLISWLGPRVPRSVWENFISCLFCKLSRQENHFPILSEKDLFSTLGLIDFILRVKRLLKKVDSFSNKNLSYTKVKVEINQLHVDLLQTSETQKSIHNLMWFATEFELKNFSRTFVRSTPTMELWYISQLFRTMIWL